MILTPGKPDIPAGKTLFIRQEFLLDAEVKKRTLRRQMGRTDAGFEWNTVCYVRIISLDFLKYGEIICLDFSKYGHFICLGNLKSLILSASDLYIPIYHLQDPRL